MMFILMNLFYSWQTIHGASQGVRDREHADFSIRQGAHLDKDTPSTPEHLKKYRKSHVNEPGKIQKHWGVANDAKPFADAYSYGKSTYGSAHVSDVIKA